MGENHNLSEAGIVPNRLAREKSPYLLQHADNPVDWYPWGSEALDRARERNVPVLVSIGYSACHWCHVMAHESFEDAGTAHIMNDLFVNIKVDREERPDVDSIYMEAVQALTGQGGWPLNIFLTPDGRPFFGGTYFPPDPRQGMPSWRQILDQVAAAYSQRRTDVLQNADTLTTYIREAQNRAQPNADLPPDILVNAYHTIASQVDWTNGGFGRAPKFPQPLALELGLRLWKRLDESQALGFVELTLGKMASGGIFDHLGGGFHRYTVDNAWVVPHFEKMLYDNALLARVYTLAWQATRNPLFRSTAEATLDYLLRDMRSSEGAFYSAEDADSEGEEGKFYVWTPQEVESVLGADAAIAAEHWGVHTGGNFEGRTILTLAASAHAIAESTGMSEPEVAATLDSARSRLFLNRKRRVAPGKDTKILAGWNGLTVRALAEAGRTFGRSDYLAAAVRAADFVLTDMRPGGELVRSYRDGPAPIPAFLEDYAFVAEALISLYESTFDIRHLRTAEELVAEMSALFRDPDSGLFYDTRAGRSDLVVRPRGLFDNPIPSGSSAATLALLRLEAFTGEGRYTDAAVRILSAVSDLVSRAPLGFAYLLCGLDFYLSTPLQIAIVGSPAAGTQELAKRVFDRYLPNRVIAVGEGGEIPLLRGRALLGGQATAYVCEHFTCRMPVTDPEELSSQLASFSTPTGSRESLSS